MNPRGISFAAKGDHEKAISDFSQAIQLNPQGYIGYTGRARSYLHRSEYEKAIADYEKAVALDPKDPDVFNGLARLLATCPDDTLRNGTKACEIAAKALDVFRQIRLGNGQTYGDTWAAAHAEAGDFESATAMQQVLVERAPPERKAEFQSHLNLYLAGKPLREAMPGSATLASDPELLPEIKTATPHDGSSPLQSSTVVVEEEQDEGVVLRLAPEKPAGVVPQP